jgi:hypothetical protein
MPHAYLLTQLSDERLDVNTSFYAGKIYQRCVYLACLPLLFSTGVSEARVFFYPGDAFFHAVITREDPTQITDWANGPLKLRYEPPISSPPSLGAHLGFPSANVNHWSVTLSTNLKSGFSLCELDKPKESEPAKVHLFIYNQDFDPKKFHIGLKYNESWNEPVENGVFPSIGASDPIVFESMYAPFSSSKKMIVEDWLHSRTVDPLAAELPTDVKWKQVGKLMTEPVSIDAEKCVFILVNDDLLERVIQRKAKARFVRVSRTEATLFKWQNGGWNKLDKVAE